MSAVSRLLVLLLLLPCGGRLAGDYDAERAELEALGKLEIPPAVHGVDGHAATPDSGGIRAVFFDALEYQGRPTRVFAWLGIPKAASVTRPVPGIVLVHGGGGSAFRHWVERWVARGYAAISIAVEGQTDIVVKPGRPRQWARHAWSGPARQGIYGDTGESFTDQWMYHAVADVVLANSLLRSLPEVDADRVGLMGISWGGIITSTVMGIDSRFAFAMPTYGCGHLHRMDNQYARALADDPLFQQVWDPAIRIDRAEMPALWLSWPGDGRKTEDRRGRKLARARDAETDHNIYFCKADPGLGEAFLSAQQAQGVDGHSLAVDPMLVDPDNGDFRFRPGSPALSLGIVPIDVSAMGLHKS